MSKMTIYEMAEKAKVSIATISRAANPATRSKVSSETLVKIDKLLERHRYTTNLAARNLTRTTTKTIGILMPHHPQVFLEDFYCKILSGVSDAMIDSEYRLKMVLLKCEKKWDAYNFRAGEGIDGIIVIHWHAFFSNKSVLEKLGVPAVIISDVEKNIRAHFVSGDHFQGGRLAAETLYSQGHRKIGVFTGPPDSADSQLRMKGFANYLAEKGIILDPDAIVCGHFQEEKAYALAGPFLQRQKNLTALFCLNDGMALGVLRKLQELGIRCPEQLSVLGYDGDKRGESSQPPLTTVSVPLYEIAKEATERLVRYLEAPRKNKDFYFHQTLVPVALTQRGSVRPPG